MSRTMIDLTGKEFDFLTVLRMIPERTEKEIMWECQCKCGRIHIVAGCNLRGKSTRSCGKCGLVPRSKFSKGHKIPSPMHTKKPKPEPIKRPVKLAKPKKEMHGRTKDLTGLKIDNAVVLKYIGPGPDKGIQWLCRCDKCGEGFVESSLKLLEAHNEIRRRHRHKCAAQTPSQPTLKTSFDIGHNFRKGKAYRANLLFDKKVILEVIAYQRATGSHVVFGL